MRALNLSGNSHVAMRTPHHLTKEWVKKICAFEGNCFLLFKTNQNFMGAICGWQAAPAHQYPIKWWVCSAAGLQSHKLARRREVPTAGQFVNL
jgi:hypothetical protein